MANEPNSEKPAPIINSEEVSLEDIDKILEDSDPGFAAALNEVREATESTDVEIESIAIDEKSLDDTEVEPESPSVKRFARTFNFFANLKMRARNALMIFSHQALVWVKVRPKEYLLFILSQLKVVLKFVGLGIKKFLALSLAKKMAILGILVIGAGAFALIAYNLKGRWLPQIDRPLIVDYKEVADQTWDVSQDRWLPLFQALRQPEHRYLFDKVVVNLRRIEGASNSESNPMGLFEFYVELDSKRTAVEVNDRKLELLDLVQRTIEGETYTSLVGEPGKQRLKNLIRQEMNEVLNQGWVKDVYISNMVLKP